MINFDNETIILLNPNLPSEELEELFAIKALVNNPNAILQNIMAFSSFCLAVNGIIPNPESVEIPNLLMVCGAVYKAEKALNKKLLFLEPADHQTITYIANIAFDEGWVILPDILKFAQKELNKLTSNYAKELFDGITIEMLLNMELKEDSELPIVNHAAKMQTINEYLKLIEK